MKVEDRRGLTRWSQVIRLTRSRLFTLLSRFGNDNKAGNEDNEQDADNGNSHS